jgi:hypothetical protein
MLKKPQNITPAVVAAFKNAREIIYADGDAREVRSRRNEYLQACSDLHRLLKRKPWEIDLMAVDSDQPPGWIAERGEAYGLNTRSWAEARQLRLAIERAAA